MERGVRGETREMCERVHYLPGRLLFLHLCLCETVHDGKYTGKIL